MAESLFGMEIRVNDLMVGSKSAVASDGVIHVSPAMFDLMRHAEADDIRRLMDSIPVLKVSGRPF